MKFKDVWSLDWRRLPTLSREKLICSLYLWHLVTVFVSPGFSLQQSHRPRQPSISLASSPVRICAAQQMGWFAKKQCLSVAAFWVNHYHPFKTHKLRWNSKDHDSLNGGIYWRYGQTFCETWAVGFKQDQIHLVGCPQSYWMLAKIRGQQFDLHPLMSNVCQDMSLTLKYLLHESSPPPISSPTSYHLFTFLKISLQATPLAIEDETRRSVYLFGRFGTADPRSPRATSTSLQRSPRWPSWGKHGKHEHGEFSSFIHM